MVENPDLVEAARTAAEKAEPLRRSLVDLGRTLLKRQKEIDQKKARIEEDMKRGGRLTKHRFSL